MGPVRSKKRKVERERWKCIICHDEGAFLFTPNRFSPLNSLFPQTCTEESSRIILHKLQEEQWFRCPRLCRADNFKARDLKVKEEAGARCNSKENPTDLLEKTDRMSDWLFTKVTNEGIHPEIAIKIATKPNLDVTQAIVEAGNMMMDQFHAAQLQLAQNMSKELAEERILESPNLPSEDWNIVNILNDANITPENHPPVNELLLLLRKSLKWYGPIADTYARNYSEFVATLINLDLPQENILGFLTAEIQALTNGIFLNLPDEILAPPAILSSQLRKNSPDILQAAKTQQYNLLRYYNHPHENEQLATNNKQEEDDLYVDLPQTLNPQQPTVVITL